MNKGEKIVTKFKRSLERNATKQEIKFRHFLNKKRMPYEFQKMLKGESGKWYIADFYLPEFRAVIEIDGAHHYKDEKQYNKDRERTFDLEKLGYKVIRLRNSDITSCKPAELKAIINRKYTNYVPSIYYKPPQIFR